MGKAAKFPHCRNSLKTLANNCSYRIASQQNKKIEYLLKAEAILAGRKKTDFLVHSLMLLKCY